MFASQIKVLTLKACPLCTKTLETTTINGRDRLVCFACEFVHWDNPIPVTATIIPYISAASASESSPQRAYSRSPVRRLLAAFGSLFCRSTGKGAASASESSPPQQQTHPGSASEASHLSGRSTSLSSPSENKRIVLVKRKYPPFVDDWCLPGGFIEAHESPDASATREVLEETGLNINIDHIIGAHSPGKGINVIIIFYLAKPVHGNLTAGDDASDVAVFEQNNLPSNIAFPLHKQKIDEWFNNQL